MMKPAIVALGVVVLERSIHPCAVSDVLIVRCSCQIIECAHDSRVCGSVFGGAFTAFLFIGFDVNKNVTLVLSSSTFVPENLIFNFFGTCVNRN